MIIGIIIFFAFIWIIVKAFSKNKTTTYDTHGNVTGYQETKTAGNTAAGCVVWFFIILIAIVVIGLIAICQ